MRVGLIGAGLQAGRRLAAIQQHGDEVVVVAAAQLAHAQAMAARAGAGAVEGWEPVVCRDDLDVVVVATPPHLHAEITVAALQSGKHVLCEKPISRTVAEAVGMIEAAERARRVLKCGFNHRHHPALAAARSALSGSDLGTPVFGRAIYGIVGRPGLENEWRSDPTKVPGGQLAEQGIHVIDLFQLMVGPVAAVTARVAAAYWEVSPLEDNAFVIMETADGVLTSLHSSTTQWRNRFELEVFTTDGYVRVTGLGASYGTETLHVGHREFSGPFTETTSEFRGGDVSWLREWDELRSAMAAGAGVLPDAHAGLSTLRVVEAAYASSACGRRIELAGVAP